MPSHSGKRFLAAAGVIFLALSAEPTCAQDFSSLTLDVGDIVYVTSPSSGATVRGALTRLTPTVIALGPYELPYEPGLSIARDGDHLWNGFAIGFVVGAIIGGSVGAEGCLDTPRWHCGLGGGLVYGGIGALIDRARKGQTVIFEAPGATKPSVRLAPVITPTSQGLGVSLSF